jgi:hypothetical protein
VAISKAFAGGIRDAKVKKTLRGSGGDGQEGCFLLAEEECKTGISSDGLFYS